MSRRASRTKRKTTNTPHPPYTATEKFYVGSLIISVSGFVSGIDPLAASGVIPNWLYSVLLGVQGSGVNIIMVLMVMNWIAIMTARGKDTSMLPWVRRTYNAGVTFSLLDFLITAIEEFTVPEVDGAFDGTVNGVKHFFLGTLEGGFCILGLYYALKMKKQIASGGTGTEKQKQQVYKIVKYNNVLIVCGTIGVLFRYSRFFLRASTTVYPAPACSAVGFLMGALVEILVLVVVFAVVMAQRPGKQRKIRPHGETNVSTTVVSSSSTTTG